MRVSQVAVGLLAVGVLLVGACSSGGSRWLSGEAQSTAVTTPAQVSTPPTTTSTFDSYPRRTNRQNAMVKFEPCTAYTDAELDSLGIASSTREDIASADNFRWRGCRWELPRRGQYRRVPGAVSQGVISGQWQDALNSYNPYDKIDRVITIGDYEIAVAYSLNGDECMYWVNVDTQGMVLTTVYPRGLELMSHAAACQLADRFTRLMLPRLPR